MFEWFINSVLLFCVRTVFIRFEERDAAEAALLALMDTDQFERLTIPAQRPFSSAGGGIFMLILKKT